MFCFRPKYPTENTEEESVMEDDAELTLRKVEEEIIVSLTFIKLILPKTFPS